MYLQNKDPDRLSYKYAGFQRLHSQSYYLLEKILDLCFLDVYGKLVLKEPVLNRQNILLKKTKIECLVSRVQSFEHDYIIRIQEVFSMLYTCYQIIYKH